MGRLIALPPGVLLSVRGFAEELNLDRDTTARRIRDAGLAPAARRGGSPVYRLRDLLRAAYLVADGFDPDELRPFERRAFYQGEHEKLRLQCERAELLARTDVEREAARIAGIVTHTFEILPGALDRDCGATPAMLARVERHIDAVRKAMSAAMIEDAAEAPAG